MRILLPLLLIAVLLYGGAINTYHAVRYRTPPATTLTETPARSLPTFVTLQDIAFDVEHMLKLEIGREIVWVPIRPKGSPSPQQYDLVVQMSAAELIAAVSSSGRNAPPLAALGRRTEVTGRISDPGRNSRQVDELRKALPSISPDVLILDEGATPGKIQGIVMLVLGIGLTAIFLRGGFKPAAPATPKAPVETTA